jgi:hypothetical protein
MSQSFFKESRRKRHNSVSAPRRSMEIMKIGVGENDQAYVSRKTIIDE